MTVKVIDKREGEEEGGRVESARWRWLAKKEETSKLHFQSPTEFESVFIISAMQFAVGREVSSRK